MVTLFSLINLRALIGADHPIRCITAVCNKVLEGMSGHFEEVYVREGRPSIPPETLLKSRKESRRASAAAGRTS